MPVETLSTPLARLVQERFRHAVVTLKVYPQHSLTFRCSGRFLRHHPLRGVSGCVPLLLHQPGF
jgi:hypothetical protein